MDCRKHSKLFHDISLRIAKLLNIVMMTAPFAVVWYRFYADKLWVTFYMRGHWMVIFLYILLYMMMDAARAFLTSEVHSMIEDPELEMWEFSERAVFDMWEVERITGDPRNSSYLRSE